MLDDAKDSVTSLQVTDHEILTGSADSKIRKYDIRNGEMISDFIGSMYCMCLLMVRPQKLFNKKCF